MALDATALILEDSETQGQIIAKMVEAQGWTAFHCKSLREAHDALSQMSVQALFLDVFVGVYNSLVHIDKFRELAPDVPIIVMTAGNSKEAIEETLKAARTAKADYVLKKPFSETQLKDIFSSAYNDLSSRRRRKHVLVIDDSQTIRTVATGMFESAGYRVSQADSMEAAFDNIDVAHVDLALCDIFMPGMGGFKGIRTIKRVWPHVKIVAMSAGIANKLDDDEALNAARKIGADAQIKKPFTSDDLIELTDMVLEADGAERVMI